MPRATAIVAAGRCAASPTGRPRTPAASGRPVALEPMTSVERKIVHLHLKEVAGVATSSEGVEPNRHVIVLPEDDSAEV